MRVSSTLASAGRRSPRQTRAAQRREAFLDAAAELIGEAGYDAATMTGVAERAGASIGALYDYFPDKRALATAILDRYTQQADAHWQQVLEAAGFQDRQSFAGFFIDGVLRFAEERPAYLALVAAPLGYARSAAARKPLRVTLAKVFQKMNPALTAERAFLSAQVVVQLMKGLTALLKQVDAADKTTVTEEFKGLMASYLQKTCSPPSGSSSSAGS